MLGNLTQIQKIILLNFFCGLLILIVCPIGAAAQTEKEYVGKPVQFERLKLGLEKKSFKNAEIIDVIKACGVNFKLDAAAEKEIKQAGATAAIITAVKENLRTDTENKGISMGVVNVQAINLPPPVYPPAARAVKATGAVNVQVIITKDGSIFSAEAVSGHPLLRSAAETAARNAKFKPLLLDGQPRVVKGIIVYNFVP